jgi:hypothetical protein
MRPARINLDYSIINSTTEYPAAKSVASATAMGRQATASLFGHIALLYAESRQL